MDTLWALGKYGKYDMHYNMCIKSLTSHLILVVDLQILASFNKLGLCFCHMGTKMQKMNHFVMRISLNY